ncbi:protein DDI1 homolog 2-like [Actinia tenebrosa]|uniref:Protein DDI1 homolog 2-like n=1 Tax=Actinia tenebrosa TaxID=6105 RepID=A0A6P8IXM7_ACTTE|nr:protein DDI1 homolog 2-like [Actinia tenebrosa]
MKITVTCEDDSLFTLEISGDLELENFLALVEFELGIPASDVIVWYEGNHLNELKKTLSDYAVKEGDVLLLRRKGTFSSRNAGRGKSDMVIDWGHIPVPPTGNAGPSNQVNMQRQSASSAEENPEAIRQMFLTDPHQMSLLKERNPELANALTHPQMFAEVLKKQRQELHERNMQRIRTMNADMFDAEAQKKIAEEIRMSNVNQNMEVAMEYSPESFAKVIMLYINCTLNGYPVKAFVDSGAQMTFMSSACAERCHITRLIDHRWSGIAQGVGQQKIIGRVHLAQIQIENNFLPSSFSILEDQVIDLVLGLDMLKRHQCCIDLKDNVLVIGTTGTRTPFLPESELPSNARLSNEAESEAKTQEMEDKNLAQALARSVDESS